MMIGSRLKLFRKSSTTSDDGSSYTPPMNSFSDSSENSCANSRDGQILSGTSKVARVSIPDRVKPGQQVKLHYPDGTKAHAKVPPRSEWLYENCDGSPRPFFLAPFDPAATIYRTPPPPPIESRQQSSGPRRKQPKRCSAKSRKEVRFDEPSNKVCTCVLSQGVYDSICPYHGTFY